MNRLFLNMVMLPSALWRNLGADIEQLRAILTIRLILDDRKPVGIGRQQKIKKDRKNVSILSIVIHLFMGVFFSSLLFVVTDRIFSLTMIFSVLLTLLTLMLITDFSNVLFDVRDKYILFPRPVNDRTIVLARLLHVFIYLFRIVLPMSLPTWVMLGYLDGWKPALLFPFIVILMVCLVLFFVNVVYLIVLNVTKPEKFKDVINYFQIVTSVVFFGVFYLAPRFYDSRRPGEFAIANFAWARYSPSYWLAVCWSWIGYPVNLAGSAWLSVFAIVIPLICLYVLVKWLAPRFSQKISGIDTVDVGEYKPAASQRAAKGSRFYQKLAYMFNRGDDAKAGFMIGWLQTSRSRSFRMRVYPNFAFIPVYFVYTLTQNHTSFTDAFTHLAERRTYIMLLYMTSFVMVNALPYLSMSEQYKAAWVYYATPVGAPGKIMIGAFKAVWVKYFLPFFILVSVFVLYIWGAPVIIDILLALVNVTLFVACMARISHRHLPFSMADMMKQGGSRLVKSLLTVGVLGMLGVGHFLTAKFHLVWLEYIFLGLSSLLLWLVLDSYGNTVSIGELVIFTHYLIKYDEANSYCFTGFCSDGLRDNSLQE